MDQKSSQDSIIKAAIFIFGKHGKAQASVLEIAKRAKVSKTLIFHHFKTKAKLYQHCLSVVNKEMLNLKTSLLNEPHFFEAVSLAQTAKLSLERHYPGIFRFYSQAVASPRNVGTPIFSPRDLSRINSNVNPDLLWQLIYHLTLGYQQAFESHGEFEVALTDFQQSYQLLLALALKKEE
jgi:AcrR family transcriptional regulator